MKSLVKSNGTFFPAIPSLFDDFLTRDWLDSSLANWRVSGATLPAVNVMETNDDFKIEVAAPGMKRNDFKSNSTTIFLRSLLNAKINRKRKM